MGLIIGKGITIEGALDIQFEYPVAPVNTIIPVITGNTTRGNTLISSTGTWTGIPYDFAYTYQWQRNSSNVSGATSNSYTLTTADVGYTIRSSVTATTPSGNSIAYSLQTINILPNLPNAPTNIVASSYNSATAYITWTPPIDDGGGAITGYSIIATRLNGSGTVTTTVTGPNDGYINGLVTGGLYSFQVAAINAAGTGAYGNSTSSIYIVPALLEFYGGGYVVNALPGSAIICSPTSGGTGYGDFATCNSFCSALVLNGYSDWVVPDRNSLTYINASKSGLSIIAGKYWSSTVQAGSFPVRYYYRDFPSGAESVAVGTDGTLQVRATRTAFYP